MPALRGQYFVAVIVILMLSGGTALETFASRASFLFSTRWQKECRRVRIEKLEPTFPMPSLEPL